MAASSSTSWWKPPLNHVFSWPGVAVYYVNFLTMLSHWIIPKNTSKAASLVFFGSKQVQGFPRMFLLCLGNILNVEAICVINDHFLATCSMSQNFFWPAERRDYVMFIEKNICWYLALVTFLAPNIMRKYEYAFVPFPLQTDAFAALHCQPPESYA